MRGFTVNMNDIIASAALDTGIVGIIITNKSGDLTLDFSEMNDKGDRQNWISESLKLGDHITIEYENLSMSP